MLHSDSQGVWIHRGLQLPNIFLREWEKNKSVEERK